jgi:hypothetical protein
LIQDNDSQKRLSCEEAAKNATQVRAGMQESEVIDLVGQPAKRADNEWIYPFYACIPRPEVGKQIIIGMGVVFENGNVIDIKYATLCATGPAKK